MSLKWMLDLMALSFTERWRSRKVTAVSDISMSEFEGRMEVRHIINERLEFHKGTSSSTNNVINVPVVEHRSGAIELSEY